MQKVILATLPRPLSSHSQSNTTFYASSIRKFYFVTLPYYGGAAANSSITVESDVIVETNDETGVINHTITHQPNLPPIGKKTPIKLKIPFR